MPGDPNATGGSVERPPAFQFYPQDFLVGTAAMTLEECGAYMRLLCQAWASGGIPADTARIARVLGLTAAEFERIWPAIESKWEQRGNVLVNLRMERERERLEDFRKERAAAGRRGAQKKWENERKAQLEAELMAEPESTDSSASDLPMANGMAKPSSSSSSSSSSSTTPSTSSSQENVGSDEVAAIFEFWKTTLSKNGATKLTPKRKRKIQQRLQDSTLDEIQAAIRGVAASQWHRENGHTDIELICRDRGQIEKYAARHKVTALPAKPSSERSMSLVNRGLQAMALMDAKEGD